MTRSMQPIHVKHRSWSLFLACALFSGCGTSEANPDPTASGGDGSGGTSAEGGGPVLGGSTSAAGGNDAGLSSGGDGAGGDSGFTEEGQCGRRIEATVTDDSFSGFMDFYLIGAEQVEQGISDQFICAVRFTLERVDAGPEGCTDGLTNDPCAWSHGVALSDPSSVTDEAGVCAQSELGFDQARIDELDGSEAAFGFFPNYLSHSDILLTYEEATSSWLAQGAAVWDATTGMLSWQRGDGACRY
jgi:hypothetical protein